MIDDNGIVYCENSMNQMPGKMIKTKGIYSMTCADCGRQLNGISTQTNSHNIKQTNNWDQFFLNNCIAISTKSPCKSRQIGALIVKDKSIIVSGYNGPPRGFPHCDPMCSRKLMGIPSGERLDLCPAQHAETNALCNAARLGVSVIGSTLYMNAPYPCKNCIGMLINAGISEIVVTDNKAYDDLGEKILKNSNIKIRTFNI